MHTQPIHIVGISGSLRQRSYNTALLRAAATLLPQGVTFEIADLSGLPMYNGDVEAAGTPEAVLAFRETVRSADSLLIASPEYNYSITGALKNALDWASRNVPDRNVLDGKTIAIMGAGGRMGTVRAQDHLRDILLHNDTFVLSRPALMLARAGHYFDDDLNLTDAETAERLTHLVRELINWTLRLRATADVALAVPA
jgi:chromate reductase